MQLAPSSKQPWEMAGIGGFERGKMAGHHYCSALLLWIPHSPALYGWSQ